MLLLLFRCCCCCAVVVVVDHVVFVFVVVVDVNFVVLVTLYVDLRKFVWWVVVVVCNPIFMSVS